MIPSLHIYLLGDFRLVSGETPVTTVTVPRVQSLLAYLVLHRAAPQDRSHLAFLFWPDSEEGQAHTNLRQLLYRLRQSLPHVDQFLSIDKQSLCWLPTHADNIFTLDVLEMEQALARAEKARNIDEQRAALEQVLRLYLGDLLPGCYDEWILPERDRLRQLFLQAAERLMALLEQEHAYSDAIVVAHSLLRQDPLHEVIYRNLIRLYALNGERAAALRVYHTCVTVMERELGAEPSNVTRAAYEALLPSNSMPETQASPLTTRGTEAPLIGRKEEWRHLQKIWRKAAGGQPHIVMLTGEAGIGKTRLAEEMEAWVRRQGMTTATTHCYSALERLAYAPITAWLRADALVTGLSTLDPIFLTEVARLLPEVLVSRPKLPRPAVMAEGWQRQQFFEALARAVLSARQPLLFLLDDVQWCDNETLEWLQYLFRFDPGARLLLIGTVRAEETLPGHPLIAFLSALQRDGLVTEIPLGSLTMTETTSLAEHVMGLHLESAMGSKLYSETEGNPLFVVEMARVGTAEQDGGEASLASSALPLFSQPASMLPSSIQTVLATRLAQLSPVACEVANVAAVIGREFAFSVLAQASGKDEDTLVQALDELWQRRIVREQDSGTAETYDFSHDKLREQVYTSLRPAHRRLLHRRVADSLEERYTNDLDAICGQLAVHYERASLPEKAILYYHRAGKVARDIYANAEAIIAFQRAAALLDAGSVTNGQGQLREIAAQVYESLGDTLEAVGQLQEARAAIQRAISTLPSLASPTIGNDADGSPGHWYIWHARLQRKIADTWNQASTNPHDATHVNARVAFQEAERILTLSPDMSSPAWRNEWIELQFAQIWPLRGSIDDMMVVLERARPFVEQYGTQEQREMLFFATRTQNLIRARYVIPEKTIFFLRDKLAEIERAGDKNKAGTFHFVLGLSLLWAGNLDEAEEHLKGALLLAEQIGIAWLQSRCLTFLPFIFRRRGQLEQVRDLLAHARSVGIEQNNSILTGQHAWVAWREGNLSAAETYGRKSLEGEQGQPRENYPFQWVGRWPLIGVALAQERIAPAFDDVRMLLDKTQQPPPEALRTLLEAAMHAWDAAQHEEARAILQEATSLAEQMGYL